MAGVLRKKRFEYGPLDLKEMTMAAAKELARSHLKLTWS